MIKGYSGSASNPQHRGECADVFARLLCAGGLVDPVAEVQLGSSFQGSFKGFRVQGVPLRVPFRVLSIRIPIGVQSFGFRISGVGLGFGFQGFGLGLEIEFVQLRVSVVLALGLQFRVQVWGSIKPCAKDLTVYGSAVFGSSPVTESRTSQPSR